MKQKQKQNGKYETNVNFGIQRTVLFNVSPLIPLRI